MEFNFTETALFFRSLGDVQRLEILKLLQKQDLCAFEILKNISISQSTLSYHMKILCRSKIVVSKRVGKSVIYSLTSNAFQDAIKLLEEFGKI